MSGYFHKIVIAAVNTNDCTIGHLPNAFASVSVYKEEACSSGPGRWVLNLEFPGSNPASCH